MRVLHFYKTYHPDPTGGVQQVIHQIANACHPHGIQTDVLTLSRHPASTPLQWGHETIHQVPCNLHVASTSFSLQAITRFKQLAHEVDLIHYHYPWPFMDMVHFLTRVKKPTVLTYHADVVKQKWLWHFYRPLAKQFLKQMDQIIATSPQYALTSPMLQAFQHKTRLIPIGISPPPAPPLTSKTVQIWRERCGERFFLFIGVLRYYKGLAYLIDALKNHDYPTIIAGSGPMENVLKQQAKKNGLKHLQFVGPVSEEDKFALLQAATAFVFPSHLRSEAFGIALLEASLMSKPLISCTIQTGTSYINRDGITGWEVAPADPVALQQALSACWHDPQEALKRGLAAKQRYESHFTAQQMGERYAALYQQLGHPR